MAIKIGLIDDRKNERESIKERLEMEFASLGVEWIIQDYEPLNQLELYPEWLKNEKIDVLIADEMLNEQSLESGNKAPYNGHTLISFIRSFEKTLPMFIITSYATNEDLIGASGSVDNIIDRISFAKHSDQYVNTIIRVSNKYLETFENEFTQLSELSEKIATGEASGDQINQAKAIQEKLHLPYYINAVIEREEAIKEFDNELLDLDELRQKIENFLKENKK